MNLLDSLLDALVRLDGDALVMHVGEKPYVVTTSEATNPFRGPLAWGQVELSSRVLTTEAVVGMLGQILPADQRTALDEFGATEFEVRDTAGSQEPFTIVAARGGDDIWLEVRRMVKAAQAEALPVAEDGPAADAPGSPAAAAVEPLESPEAHPIVPAAAADVPAGPGQEDDAEPIILVAPPAMAAMEDEALDRDLQESLAALEASSQADGGVGDPLPEGLESLAAAGEWGADVLTEADLGELLAGDTFGDSAVTPDPALEAPLAAGGDEVPPMAQPGPLAQEPAPAAGEPAPVLAVYAPLVESAGPAVAGFGSLVEDAVRAAEAPRTAAEAAVLAARAALMALQEASDQPPAEAAADAVPAGALPDTAPPPPGAEAIVAEAPMPQAAVADEPATREPVGVEPMAEEPVSEDPVTEEPMAEEPVAEEPVRDEPQVEEPESRRALVVPLARVPRGDAAADRGTAAQTLQRVLGLAAARGAESLYIVAQSAPLVRVDGEFSPLEGEPALGAALVERLLAELAPRPRDAASPAPAAWIAEVPEIGRVRCVTFRDHRGPGVICRIVSPRAISADQLGLPSEVQALCSDADGLVLVAGSRGSGKSTVLTSFVDLINRTRSDHTITIEAQIEFVHENRRSFISQREVRGDGDAVASAVKAACREEPDVLVIDELRSPEVASLAIEAAEAGRLVFASIPAVSAVAAVERVIEMFPPERREKAQAALAGTLRGVVSQVLLRRLRGGRVAAREVLLNTPAVANLILEGKTFQLPAALEHGHRHGMMPFAESLATLVREGAVHPAHAYRKAPDREQFLAILRREGVDTSLAERLA